MEAAKEAVVFMGVPEHFVQLAINARRFDLGWVTFDDSQQLYVVASDIADRPERQEDLRRLLDQAEERRRRDEGEQESRKKLDQKPSTTGTAPHVDVDNARTTEENCQKLPAGMLEVCQTSTTSCATTTTTATSSSSSFSPSSSSSSSSSSTAAAASLNGSGCSQAATLATPESGKSAASPTLSPKAPSMTATDPASPQRKPLAEMQESPKPDGKASTTTSTASVHDHPPRPAPSKTSLKDNPALTGDGSTRQGLKSAPSPVRGQSRAGSDSDSDNATASASTPEASRQLRERVQRLAAENRKLKQRKLCRACRKVELGSSGITFLPCGHFITCETCSEMFDDCPACGKNIMGTVRTFLS